MRPQACILCLILAAAPAVAQQSPPPSTPPTSPPPAPPSSTAQTQPELAPPASSPPLLIKAEPAWTIRIDPTIWWVSPAGDLKLPSMGLTGGDSVELKALNLDTPEFTPAGSVAINASDFRFTFFGAAFSRDANATADAPFQIGDVSLAAGDPFESEFEFNLFEVTAGYRFLSYDWRACSMNQEECVDAVLDLYGLAGGRFFDMNIGVTAPGGPPNDTDQFFGEVMAGVRAELIFLSDFNINVQVTGGGMGDSDRSSFSFGVEVSGEWRPTKNVGVQIGWRHLSISLEDGDGPEKFELDGSLAGVFASVTFRF